MIAGTITNFNGVGVQFAKVSSNSYNVEVFNPMTTGTEILSMTAAEIGATLALMVTNSGTKFDENLHGMLLEIADPVQSRDPALRLF